MSIVCGSDFSEGASHAARVAAAIAERLGQPLELVNVIDELGGELTFDSPANAVYDPVRRKAEQLATALAEEFDIQVNPLVTPGIAHEKLVEIASVRSADLLVVASSAAAGAKKQARWLLGSTAERVARKARGPVLIVRDPDRIESWARGEALLRVMVGVDLEPTAKAALSWAASLRAIGRCEITVEQVVWTTAELSAPSASAAGEPQALQPQLREDLIRDLQDWAGELAAGPDVSFNVTAASGRTAAQLSKLASDGEVDLLVIGTHQRSMVERLWQGSVSRGVLLQACCNIACVPPQALATAEKGIPTFRRILVPTDFSLLGNSAISVAYGLAAHGGIVHLLHVVTHDPEPIDAQPAKRLSALVPRGALARGVFTECEVVVSRDAATGIAESAERLEVDLVCMATRARSGVARLVLGSQAANVLSRVRQPVVLVPPEEER